MNQTVICISDLLLGLPVAQQHWGVYLIGVLSGMAFVFSIYIVFFKRDDRL